MKSVTSASELQKAFAQLLQGGGLGTGRQRMTVALADGQAKVTPFVVATPDSEVSVEPRADLPNGVVSTVVMLSAKPTGDLPPLRIVYEGTLGQMKMRTDTAALSEKLGTALIAKDMAALDEIQKQQEKLAADQAAQTQADKDKYEAFQAQRAELRLQVKALKVHAAQREIDAAQFKARVDAAVSEGNVLNDEEKQRLMRRLQ